MKIVNGTNPKSEIIDKEFSKEFFNTQRILPTDFRVRGFLDSFSVSHPLKIRAHVLNIESVFSANEFVNDFYALISKVSKNSFSVNFITKNLSSASKVISPEQLPDYLCRAEVFQLLLNDNYAIEFKPGRPEILNEITNPRLAIEFLLFFNLLIEGLLPLILKRQAQIKRWGQEIKNSFNDLNVSILNSTIVLSAPDDSLKLLKHKLNSCNYLYTSTQDEIKLQIPFDFQENNFIDLLKSIKA